MSSLPTVRFAALIIAGSAGLAGMDLGMSSSDVRMVVGAATPLTKVQVNGITTAGNVDQRLDANRKIGPHLGLQYQFTRTNAEGVGWLVALEGAWDHHLGTVRDVNGQPTPFATDGASMALDTWMGTLFAGPSLQADLRDMGVRADTFRVEAGPLFGFGAAQAQVDGNNSQSGSAWSAGGQVALVVAFENDLTLALNAGYEYTQARITWDNTGDSYATAQGPIVRLGLGYRW